VLLNTKAEQAGQEGQARRTKQNIAQNASLISQIW
jgi:hypothetical protein